MKIRGIVSASAVLILIISAQDQLYGWGNTWMGALIEQAVTQAWGMASPFRYNAALRIDSASYDSDIYYGMLANSVPDFTIAAGPDLQVFLPIKQRVVFDIFESPRYVYYVKTSQERTLNNIFSADMHVILDRLYFQAGGGLTDAKQRFSPELNLNVRLKEDDLSGLALWQASGATSFALQCQRSTYRYEDLSGNFPSISQSLDRTESFINLFAYLQQHSRARFYLEGQYGSYVFTEEVSSFKNSRSYAAYVGVEFVPPAGGFEDQTSGMRGNFGLGYKYLNILNPDYKGYSGLAGNIDISLGILKLTALRLYFSRNPQFSVYPGLTYYLQTSYGAGLSRALARHVLFMYDFSYSRDDYPAAEATGGSPLGGSAFRYITHAFRLSYQMRKDFEIGLLADIGRRNSPFAPRPVSNRAFIGINLTWGYSAGRLSLPTGPFF